MSRLNLGSVDLGDHDRDWFYVMSKLTGRSIRQNVSSVMSFYVRRRKAEYEQILRYTARKHGLTASECFRRLLNDEELGEPVASFDEPFPVIEDEQPDG